MSRGTVAGVGIGDARGGARAIDGVDPKRTYRERRGCDPVSGNIDQVFVIGIDRNCEIDRRLGAGLRFGTVSGVQLVPEFPDQNNPVTVWLAKLTTPTASTPPGALATFSTV